MVEETAPAQSQGVPLENIQTIARYWATEYDWHKGNLLFSNGSFPLLIRW
ncbi:epoxide hydrolase N-terminal domain-containing protein [Lysinibacillus sp. FJAT-14745]